MIYPRSSRLKSARAIALAFALAISSFSSLAHAPAQVQATQAPPYQWPRSHDYDVQHYRIVVSFDWARQEVKGETTITFKPFNSDLKEVEIDAGDMTIESVKLAGGTPLKFRYEDNEKLYVALDRAYAAGATVGVVINYTAMPKRGLTFITPNEDDPARPHQIWSQGESEDNHYWFPCYDYPNDKATTELIATVDEKYRVISNGTLIGVRPDPARRARTFHWKMDRPYSSYLISIIVGEFGLVKDQFKNVPIESYVYADQVENARISFGKIGQMMSFFSKRIGYDFPYTRYAQTTVRDFGGGMENITATTLSDTSVHDKRAHIDLSSDSLLAHELAHSWFGNLLTCRDWGELWLNESFATFIEAAWTEHDLGRDEYLYEMLRNQQTYLGAWAQGNRRPIVIKRYADPDSLFDAYPYQRGGAVLNMLRFVLGEEPFWKAINHYVRKYEWQNVETQQLVVAIEEATGQNLQWFFDEWVYKMGHPEFEITSSYDEGGKSVRLSVKQAQKPDQTRAWFQTSEFFTTPVDVAITTASGEKIHRVLIDKAEKDFTFPVDSKPLIINFDRSNYLIKEVKFNRSDDELAYQLLHDKDATGRVLAAIELRSRKSDAAAKALGEAARGDAFWGVRVEAAKSLSDFKTDASRSALIEAVKDKDARIRREAIKGLAAFNDPKLAELYVRIINSDQSYFVVAEAARALGQGGAPNAFDVLSDSLKLESWQDTIRTGVVEGLASLKDPRSLEIGLKYAARRYSTSLRASAFKVIGATGKGNDRAYEILTNGLKERSSQLRLAAIQALGMLGDTRAIPALEEAAKSSEVPANVKQFINIVIDQIRNTDRKR